MPPDTALTRGCDVLLLEDDDEHAIIFAAEPRLDLAMLGPPSASSPPAISPARRNPAWCLPHSGFSVDRVVDALVSADLAFVRTGPAGTVFSVTLGRNASRQQPRP